MKIISDENILRKPNAPVTVVETLRVRQWASQMYDLMVSNSGCGIAAPQVGINKTFFLARIDGKTRLFINPKILEVSEETAVGVEGCLSVPGLIGNVERHTKIKVKYNNGERPVTEELDGFNAIVFQHEFDHLQGTLYTDKATEIRPAEEKAI